MKETEEHLKESEIIYGEVGKGEDCEKKKLKTFLFEVGEIKYFFVILYGEN